ncbi:MAG: histidine--tRNA ligase [Betaproteobacteria bacterium TMED156]|nr:MAG: histidine--tRNA ligase [Betaproteobacteria bacterium TMED156]
MNDLLPNSTNIWSEIENRVKNIFARYGYEEIRTPIVESTDLFKRGIGEITDIVEKEMYSFVDNLNGDSLTLRPENTAAVARAVVEHNLTYDGPKKLWYYGPMFRHERPQRGRYRQFNQFGLEAFGYDGPEIEAEQLFLINRLWGFLGFNNEYMPSLELNCLGSTEERILYKKALTEYFLKFSKDLDDDSKRRLDKNPLRILDSKNLDMKDLIKDSPKITNFLGKESIEHNERLTKYLRDLNINFKFNTCLVRGLDYYNLTVFEWKHEILGAQSTICGGGRYDNLVKVIGGKSLSAFGFAIGMERLIDLIKSFNTISLKKNLDLYITHIGKSALAKALIFAEQVRDTELKIKVDMSQSSIKTQMKRASLSGASFVAILGDSELDLGCMTLRPLSKNFENFKAHQKSIPLESVADFLLNSLKNMEKEK